MGRLPETSRSARARANAGAGRNRWAAAALLLFATLPSLASAQANPPNFSKDFGGANAVAQNSVVSLNFSISNPNFDPDPPNNPSANITLTGISFTDTLPAGLVIATPSQLTSDCGGTVTAVAGSSSITLSGGTLDPPPPALAPTAVAQGSCAVTVMVLVNATGGTLVNTTSQITTNESAPGGTATATLSIIGALDVQKQFGAANIPLNGSTTLTFTITDPANPDLFNGQISDTLPSGLVVANPANASTTCTGGTVGATPGASAVDLTGFSFPAGNGDSCQFAVDVTGVSAGMQANTAGALTMNFDNGSEVPGVVGSNQAQASIDVIAPPTITKTFSPTTIQLNGVSTLTFTLANPAVNDASLDGVAFTDALPSGLVVAAPNGLTNSCGGTATATAGSSSIDLTGGSIATNTTCAITVDVTSGANGQYTNTTGNVTSTNGGTGGTATANLIVDAPPSITKLFAQTTIPQNGTTTIDFQITNPNTSPLTGVAFTDNLVSGLVVGAAPAPTNSCGGTVTASAGSSTISLSGGSLAASASCDVVVAVQGTTPGFKPNSVTISSTEGGVGNTFLSGVTVIPAPSIAKAFGAAAIPLNGSTSLTFTITNLDPESSQSGIAVTDALPAGLVVATPNGQTGSCGAGTITAAAGSNGISLTGGTLGGGGTCTFAVNVTGIAAGTQTNTTGNVTSTEGGTGGTATASLDVEGPPSIAKSFAPAAIAVGATTSLTFAITNPAANAQALSGVAFTDSLPSGLTVASATTAVCGGTLTVTAPTGIALTGASIAVGSQCQFSLNVAGAAAGQYTNTTGNVTSTNGGTGNTASASLSVAAVPTIAKAFGAATIALNGTTTLTFNLVNPNNTALTGVGFSDNLPAGLAVATTPGATNSCGGTFSAAAGANSVSLVGGNLAASASCSASVNVTGIAAGSQNNTTGPIASNESGTGAPSNTATLLVVAPPAFAKAFGAASIPQFGSTTLTITIQNGNNTGLSGIALFDDLPAGLLVSAVNALSNSCGGVVSAAPGASTINLSGGSLAANASCAISVSVTGSAVGSVTNVTGNITSTEGGNGGTATASLQIAALVPPTIAKAFGAARITIGATTPLSFTITNPNPISTLTGIGFTDPLPAGLVVSNPNGLTGDCGGGTITAAPDSSRIALSGASLPGGGSCTFSVSITANKSGNFVNVTSAVSSNEAGAGGTSNAAPLRVAAPVPTPTPMLDRWALWLLILALAGFGALRFARRGTR